MSNTNIRIAVQKSGRLSDDSLKLFKECGIKFESGGSKLRSISSNFPIEFLFLRDDDIPGYVEDGVADLGVIGLNVLEENRKEVEIVKELGFSKCRLSLAIPRNEVYTDLSYFEGKNIATSYPNLTNNFLKSKGITAHTHEISGSVEIAPSIGLAEGICDIVSTGGTLLSNGLKEVAEVFKSQAVLISNNSLTAEKKSILDKLTFRIDSVQRGQNAKYVVLNAEEKNLEKIIALLPGMKSPSRVPLAEKGWYSLHSVISENDFWEIIESLREAGAQGILVLPIEKMIL
ncbi:ATP phosphoribosyltransferase [Aquirufa ecclesiirivi]|uniref:ATP phosphoribosyltransferase n=1 Tax=Aquirufa ecclesiirivi TaxID=2715124 RepID=A0ABT4JD03_9BACT|nr:ATP phosphoribosyltransferase [Aquirufa ecclesiirivi]MCZ2474154.1 ATP phosphoribosyltransferase [Aquirufa ecclesiirivi]MDF0693876.1 ATP phosphoribosyltransferase [Aquirufa ecclesiirivi]